MSIYLKRQFPVLRVAGVISFLALSTMAASAQNAPVSPDHPWHTSTELSVEADARNIPDSRFVIDSAKTYSLSELIDLAEAHNPATRVSWERARAQAAALGVSRSELFPTLAAAAAVADKPPRGLLWQSLLRPGSPGFPGGTGSQLHSF